MTKQTIIATDDNIYEVVNNAIMDGMSEFLESGKIVDLNHIDVSRVTYMVNLFVGQSIGFDVSNWDVSNVQQMDCIFQGSLFSGDISKWKINNRCKTFYAINVYQLRNGIPSELAYMNRAHLNSNFVVNGSLNDYIESKLRMGCHVGTFSEPEEQEFMHYAKLARNIHAGLGSNLYGAELGRFAWELRQKNGTAVDTLELPADIFEMDE